MTFEAASRRFGCCLLLVVAMAGCTPDTESGVDGAVSVDSGAESAGVERLRVGLFNIKELRLRKIESEPGSEGHEQLRAAGEIIKLHHPDILVINEIDALPGRLDEAARRFEQLFLEVGDDPIHYPHLFVAPTNTGELSGYDFDNDGTIATDADRGERSHGNDSFGYGTYPGEYGMALLSQFPISLDETRTFQRFLWRDLPGALLPLDWYSDDEAAVFRLSSKSHWDVSVEVGDRRLHLLMSHPTPPVFDGDEDRNGKRNFDEIKFWRLFLDGDPALYDDNGSHEPLASDSWFVIAGDLNAAPTDPVVYGGTTSIGQLLDHPRIQDTGSTLVSEGALAGRFPGPPDFFERATTGFAGGKRIDYLLPSADLVVEGGGVYWPAGGSEAEQRALLASDHRFVWLDLSLPER